MFKVLIGMVIIGLIHLVGCSKSIQRINAPDETVSEETERDDREIEESESIDLLETKQEDSEEKRVFSDDDDRKYSNRVNGYARDEGVEDVPTKGDEAEVDDNDAGSLMLQKVSIDNLTGSISELETLLSQQGIQLPGKHYINQFSNVTELMNSDNPGDMLSEIEGLMSSQGIRIPSQYAQYGDMLNMNDPDWAITEDGFIGAYMGSELDAVIPSRINGIDVKGVLNVVSSGDVDGMSGLIEQVR